MGFILFIIAQLTTPIFNNIGMIYACFRIKSIREANNYYRKLAISKDQHSNVCTKYLFNDIMIIRKKDPSQPYRFGNEDETISSVFGKNQRRETLTIFGKFWNTFLNRIEKNHSELAIEEDEIDN